MFQFNAEGVSDKRQVAKNTTEFIQNRLELITSELDSVEGGMAKFKKKNQFLDVSSGAQKYSSKSANAEQKIFDIETQLQIIKSVKSTLISDSWYSLLPSNLGIEESNINGLISNYNHVSTEKKYLFK